MLGLMGGVQKAGQGSGKGSGGRGGTGRGGPGRGTAKKGGGAQAGTGTQLSIAQSLMGRRRSGEGAEEGGTKATPSQQQQQQQRKVEMIELCSSDEGEAAPCSMATPAKRAHAAAGDGEQGPGPGACAPEGGGSSSKKPRPAAGQAHQAPAGGAGGMSHALAELVGMGFEAAQAERALALAGGELGRAVELALQGT